MPWAQPHPSSLLHLSASPSMILPLLALEPNSSASAPEALHVPFLAPHPLSGSLLKPLAANADGRLLAQPRPQVQLQSLRRCVDLVYVSDYLDCEATTAGCSSVSVYKYTCEL